MPLATIDGMFLFIFNSKNSVSEGGYVYRKKKLIHLRTNSSKILKTTTKLLDDKQKVRLNLKTLSEMSVESAYGGLKPDQFVQRRLDEVF